MNDLRRMHYVAEHYHQLQGLRVLPLGLACLLAVPARQGATPLGLSPAAASLVLLAAGLAASFPIGRYYARRFGRVEPRPWRAGTVTLVASAAALLALAWLQERWPVPVSLPMLFVSAALARLGLVEGRLRVHYLWIAAACAAFAVLPLVGVPVAVRAAALDALVGGGLIVAAIGDDRVLRRVMTRPMDGGRTPS